MKELRKELENILENAKLDTHIIEEIRQKKMPFPFTQETRILSYFLSADIINYEQYAELLQCYMRRNRYLDLFDMAPRTFGEAWGESHILALFPEFLKATRENLADLFPDFAGEFDLWLAGIRVEVKACRAADPSAGGSLSSRAYLHNEASAYGFEYHFQQLKPSCCDVFIWIGVCRDALLYWVLSSNELQQTGKLSSQHRTENTGTTGATVYEGQVFMTEAELSPFLVSETEILTAVREKAGGH